MHICEPHHAGPMSVVSMHSNDAAMSSLLVERREHHGMSQTYSTIGSTPGTSSFNPSADSSSADEESALKMVGSAGALKTMSSSGVLEVLASAEVLGTVTEAAGTVLD